jgi:hypothetical protein
MATRSGPDRKLVFFLQCLVRSTNLPEGLPIVNIFLVASQHQDILDFSNFHP